MLAMDRQVSSPLANKQKEKDLRAYEAHRDISILPSCTHDINRGSVIPPNLHQRLHKGWKAIRVGTAKCDMCNKQSRGVVQTCKECGFSICSECYHAGRLADNKNHELVDGDVDWSIAPPKGTNQTTKASKTRSKKRIRLIRKLKIEPLRVDANLGEAISIDDIASHQHTPVPALTSTRTAYDDASTQTDSILLEVVLQEMSKSKANELAACLTEEDAAAHILLGMPRDLPEYQQAGRNSGHLQGTKPSRHVSFTQMGTIPPENGFDIVSSEHGSHYQESSFTQSPMSTMLAYTQPPADSLNQDHAVSQSKVEDTRRLSPQAIGHPVQSHDSVQEQHLCQLQCSSARHGYEATGYGDFMGVNNSEDAGPKFTSQICGRKRSREDMDNEPARLFCPSFEEMGTSTGTTGINSPAREF